MSDYGDYDVPDLWAVCQQATNLDELHAAARELHYAYLDEQALAVYGDRPTQPFSVWLDEELRRLHY